MIFFVKLATECSLLYVFIKKELLALQIGNFEFCMYSNARQSLYIMLV